ncbi:hypothetical protein AAHA92_01363 [Salvia divinorum]|uniref:Reverse transcriptase zinc-binding domain-containing protein n=1 Tax=Salvia divinorum TaxID=28513 RepID=A0ABD1IRZ6_SALDI
MLQDLPREEVTRLLGSWSQPKGSAEAYEWFRPKGEQRFWPKYVWKGYIPPKYSFTTWQAVKGRLMTRDRLTFLDIDRLCPLCALEPESVSHLYFKCVKTKFVWQGIKLWLGIRRPLTTIPSAIKWMARENFGSAVKKRAKWIALAALVSLIWRGRNALIFDETPFDPERLLFQIKRITYSVLYSMFSDDLVVSALRG